MRFSTTIGFHVSTLLLGAPLVTGCQHFERIDVAKITYEMLRTEDCHRNKLEDFCDRTYASEYHEYVRIRQDFMRSKTPALELRTESRDINELSL